MHILKLASSLLLCAAEVATAAPVEAANSTNSTIPASPANVLGMLPTVVHGSPRFTVSSDMTAVRVAMWSHLVRYTLFSSAANAIGPGYACRKPPFGTAVVKTFNISGTDTQATIFRDPYKKEFIVAFPGTQSNTDVRYDTADWLVPYNSLGVNCTGCHAHYGVLTQWNSISHALHSELHSLLKRYPGYYVTPTGHSLGGTLALMCYATLRGLNFPVRYVYTFGQARIYDPKGAEYVDRLGGGNSTNIGQIRRVTHIHDGVPQLPTMDEGYKHTTTEIFQKDNVNGTQTALTTWRCFGADSMNCNRGSTKPGLTAQHGMYTGIYMSQHLGCS